MSRMMSKKFAACLLVVWGLTACGANADETKVRQLLQTKFPTMTVDSVTKVPFSGLYEVVLDGEIGYTNDKVEYFLAGNLYDVRTLPPRNLTQDSAGQRAVKILSGSTDQAFKRVRGNGKRTLYTFEDPNCGYCKQLHRELAKITDVTIYTFLLPVLGPDSIEKSKAVWCASDRSKAWDEVMMTSSVTNNNKTCDTPIEKNIQLARRFGFSGTPTMYLANGQQIVGARPADQIEQALNSVK
jgi:thiol:disulfide interchange protein DsbC